jgi:hypothetical protein
MARRESFGELVAAAPVSLSVLQRTVALAAVALVAVVACSARTRGDDGATPHRAAGAGRGEGGWYTRLGLSRRPRDAERTTCGASSRRSLGVSHPCSCGAKIYSSTAATESSPR